MNDAGRGVVVREEITGRPHAQFILHNAFLRFRFLERQRVRAGLEFDLLLVNFEAVAVKRERRAVVRGRVRHRRNRKARPLLHFAGHDQIFEQHFILRIGLIRHRENLAAMRRRALGGRECVTDGFVAVAKDNDAID